MGYCTELEETLARFQEWLALYKERGGNAAIIAEQAEQEARQWIESLKSRLTSKSTRLAEPSTLEEIRPLRPEGARCLVSRLDMEKLENMLLGAWLGRAAGCILGIPCEGMSKRAIRTACKCLKLPYPLNNYWSIDPKLEDPDALHGEQTPRKNFILPNITHIGVDDDLVYTQLGLLILEQYGLDFTSRYVARAWLRYLPFAYTAEHVALQNLKKDISVASSGFRNNPYQDFIGADIRSDPWGYAAPGWMEKAAEFAHRDAWVSHRGTGIHGAMFFSAVIAAAFVVDDPEEAIRLGLTEIPEQCRLAGTVRQTLEWRRTDKDWDTTTERILDRFKGMHMAHTLHNAALTVAGLLYGQRNFTKTITLTVMGGMDTDCTGATAGSILGAMLGARRLPKKWREPLGNKMETYLEGKRPLTSTTFAKRFLAIAKRVLRNAPVE